MLRQFDTLKKDSPLYAYTEKNDDAYSDEENLDDKIRLEILKKLLKNEKMSSKRKLWMVNRLYAETTRLEESQDEFTSENSCEKENVKERGRMRNNSNANRNSSSKKNSKSSKSHSKRFQSKRVDKNNNAERGRKSESGDEYGYEILDTKRSKYPLYREKIETFPNFEVMENEAIDEMKSIEAQMAETSDKYKSLKAKKASVANKAIKNAVKINKKEGTSESSGLWNFIKTITNLLGCTKGDNKISHTTDTPIEDPKEEFKKRVSQFTTLPNRHSRRPHRLELVQGQWMAARNKHFSRMSEEEEDDVFEENAPKQKPLWQL